MNELEVYDFELKSDGNNGILVFLNENAAEHLIEMLQSLIQAKSPGAHFHVDEISGLRGDMKSIIFSKR